MSGKGGPQNPTLVGVTQYLEPEYWTWAADDAAGAALLAGGAADILAYVLQRLDHPQLGIAVTDAYAIVHDKDERKVWDEATKGYKTEPKPRHIHMVFRVKDRKDSAALASWAVGVGVAEQYVEKPKTKGGAPVSVAGQTISAAFDNMLAYLVHAKYPEKYQYEPTEVATGRGLDYQRVYAERREAWIAGRAFVTKKRAADDVEVLRAEILAGRVTRQQIVLTDEYFEVYGRHRRVLDDALEVRAMREGALASQRIGKDYRQANVFITGPTRAGKGILSDEVIGQCHELAASAGQPWRRHDAAGRNALEGAGGAETIYHDDARFYALPSYDEWLRYLDPNRSSEVAARFKNRPALAPHLVVASSSETVLSFALAAFLQKPPSELATDARKRTPVNIDEFLFRLGFVVEVHKPAGVNDPAVIAREMTVAVGKVVETDEPPRREPVTNRAGLYLGDISTTHRIEPVALIKGAARAARFLAVEIVAEYAADVAAGLPNEARVALLTDRIAFVEDETERQRLALAAAPEPVPTPPAFNPQPIVFDG